MIQRGSQQNVELPRRLKNLFLESGQLVWPRSNLKGLEFDPFLLLGEITMAVNDSVLIVRSVTNAIKGQKILESNRIPAYVQRASSLNRQGCGYALKISGNIETAVNLLARAGIQVVEIQGG